MFDKQSYQAGSLSGETAFAGDDQNGVLGGGFKYYQFSPLPGEMIQVD